jgi:N-acetylglucosamine-6-phosphate deacetylase
MLKTIDLQVNGFAGIDFSNPNLSIADIHHVSRLLHHKNIEAYLATVITSAWTTYQQVLPVISKAISQPGEGARIAGIHLEGPFISPEDGARGVHSRTHIRAPNLLEFDDLFELAEGKIRFLTLAPEIPGALELIHHAVTLGVHVAIGHTLADNHMIVRAVQAGARFSTHLGNGLPLTIHRHQNPLWSQLTNPELTALIIADGHHLPAEFVWTVLKCKGADKVIVTSDASPAAGLPPGSYEFFDLPVILEPGGRLYSLVSGMLAGSSATLMECAQWLHTIGINECVATKLLRDNALEVLKTSCFK